MVVSGLFDSHCHLDDGQFENDRVAMLGRARDNGVVLCLSAGSDVASSYACARLAGEHASVYASAGVHPHAAKDVTGNYLSVLRDLAAQPKVVAVGEIGLDYYYDNSPRDVQKLILIEQLALADELKLPVILHVREAHGDMHQVLIDRGTQHAGGVIHCFTGSLETAQQYIKFGYHISFGGALTYKNADRIRLVAAHLPMDIILIETDSPYLSPVPLRGKRNEPANVNLVCSALAAIRGISVQEVADITRRNAQDLFHIPG